MSNETFQKLWSITSHLQSAVIRTLNRYDMENATYMPTVVAQHDLRAMFSVMEHPDLKPNMRRMLKIMAYIHDIPLRDG